MCAAGNSGGANAIPPYNVIPGDYADCFTVINLRKGSSTTPNDSSGTYYVERSSSSNYNVESGEFAKAKNISAPGTAIYSTLYSGADQYGEKSGTSMASPATAGVAALMFAYDPSLSAADVQALLEQTATDINEQGWDRETGYGEVDAYHALQVLSAEIALGDVSCGESAELALSCADGSSTPASEWTWTSSDPGVLTVDTATGTAKANMRGAVTLTATHPCGREISKEVSVMAVDLSDAQIAPIDSQLYTGDALEPAISVSLNGQDLVLGTDYTVSFLGNVNVGDVATVTVNGMGNYTGTATATFTILPRSRTRQMPRASLRRSGVEAPSRPSPSSGSVAGRSSTDGISTLPMRTTKMSVPRVSSSRARETTPVSSMESLSSHLVTSRMPR